MKRQVFGGLLAAALAVAVPAAQAPPAQRPKGAVLKGKAPVNKEILKVSLPKSQEADLSNGVHLIVIEDHRAPQVFVQMLVEEMPAVFEYNDLGVRDLVGQNAQNIDRAEFVLVAM